MCELKDEHVDEATCFRFIEKEKELPKTLPKAPMDFLDTSRSYLHSPLRDKIGPSIHQAYCMPRRIHDVTLTRIPLICVICKDRTSTRKGFLAPGCKAVIMFMHWNAYGTCRTCSGLTIRRLARHSSLFGSFRLQEMTMTLQRNA